MIANKIGGFKMKVVTGLKEIFESFGHNVRDFYSVEEEFTRSTAYMGRCTVLHMNLHKHSPVDLLEGNVVVDVLTSVVKDYEDSTNENDYILPNAEIRKILDPFILNTTPTTKLWNTLYENNNICALQRPLLDLGFRLDNELEELHRRQTAISLVEQSAYLDKECA